MGKIIMLDNGKVVGEVQDNTFFKRVSGSRHFLRIPPAIAFNLETIEQAVKFGAVNICVTDSDDDAEYWSLIKVIQAKGVKFERGHGPQIYLPMKWWSSAGKQKIPDLPIEQPRLF
jgi:hypothetical protein